MSDKSANCCCAGVVASNPHFGSYEKSCKLHLQAKEYSPAKNAISNTDLADEVEQVYQTIRPLIQWIEKAMSV